MSFLLWNFFQRTKKIIIWNLGRLRHKTTWLSLENLTKKPWSNSSNLKTWETHVSQRKSKPQNVSFNSLLFFLRLHQCYELDFSKDYGIPGWVLGELWGEANNSPTNKRQKFMCIYIHIVYIYIYIYICVFIHMKCMICWDFYGIIR